MQLRNTIWVPVLNDKNLYVFVIGVLERRRDGRMMLLIGFHLGGFRRKRTKAVSDEKRTNQSRRYFDVQPMPRFFSSPAYLL